LVVGLSLYSKYTIVVVPTSLVVSTMLLKNSTIRHKGEISWIITNGRHM
jgi:hypothetical protein